MADRLHAYDARLILLFFGQFVDDGLLGLIVGFRLGRSGFTGRLRFAIQAHHRFGCVHGLFLIGFGFGVFGGGDTIDVNVEQQLDGLLLDCFNHGVVHLIAFALVFDQRIALTHTTQTDAVLEIIHLIQVFAPLAVKNREHDTTFQLTQTLFTKLGFEVGILVLCVGNDKLLQRDNSLVSLELGDSVLGGFRIDGQSDTRRSEP